MIYRQFEPNKKLYQQLSSEEKEILTILKSAVEDISKLYELQLKDGFYPTNISKKELEKAAKNNPNILSPYTIVEKVGQKFITTPFHKKYAEYVTSIAEKIIKAAKLSSNKSFQDYLEMRAKSLIDGNYKQADAAWFDVKGTRIDFMVGPCERYLDKMFLKKRSYQAFVAIIDDEMTKETEQIKEILYSSAKISYDVGHSTDIPKKGVNIYIENTIASAGYIAETIFSGEHFPLDLDLMKQYGSKIIIFYPQLKLKFDEHLYQIFQKLFEKRFAEGYSKELLLKAAVYNIVLYELGRQLHKYTGARERLKDLYVPIDEANGFVSGIVHSKYLVIKDCITQKELEAIIIIHIVWMFSDWIMNKQSGRQEGYVLGDAIIINNYLENHALMESDGISWPNFSKLFFQIENLASIFVKLLREGKYQEVKRFIDKNGSLENFKKLGRNLNTISLDI